MSNDNFMSEDDYIKTLLCTAYDVMHNMIEFDLEHHTNHAVATICAYVDMTAKLCCDMPSTDLAAVIYEIVEKAEEKLEGGDTE